MKSILSFLMILFSVSLSFSQWSVGPRVSLGFVAQKAASIPVMPMSDYLTYDLRYMGSSAVSSVGVMAYNDVGPVFLQAEALATQYKLEYSVWAFKQSEVPSYYREGYFKIEMPVAAGVQHDNFKFGVGPVFELNMSKKSELAAMEAYVDKSKNLDFGFQGMVGVKVGKFHIDMRYVNKFSSLVEDFSFGYDEFRYKRGANRLSLALGMGF